MPTATTSRQPASPSKMTGRVPAAENLPVPTRGRYPAVVNTIIALPDLVSGDGFGTLATTGEPLPAEAIADLCEQGAGVRFLLVDTDGNLAGFSTQVHDPAKAQQLHLQLRDITARTPTGSEAPVAGQDLDHIDPHGPTEAANQHPPTRGWHRAKTFGHWQLTANPDRSITWTSRRTGRTYTTHPYNYRSGP